MKINFILILILISNLSFAQNSKDSDTVTVGYVFMGFKVEETGKLTNIRVVKGLNKDHNIEILNNLEESPNWNPGKDLRGKPAAVNIVLPFKILADPDDIGTRKVKLTDLDWEKDKVQWEFFKDSLFDFNEMPLTVLCVIRDVKQDNHLQIEVINSLDTTHLYYPIVKRNDQLLELFQMCFDLNEIYTRKLRKKIANKSFFKTPQDLSQLGKWEKSINAERTNEMYKMIKETEFGNNIKNIDEWKKKLAKDLDKASKN